MKSISASIVVLAGSLIVAGSVNSTVQNDATQVALLAGYAVSLAGLYGWWKSWKTDSRTE